MDNIQKMDIVGIELNSGNLHREWLNHSIGSGDNRANRFGMRVFRDGQPVALGGASVQGYFRNSQGTNIVISSGSISGNMAYVTLPQACYNYEGVFTLAIKVIGDNVTETMRIVDGMVDNTNSGNAVAPTGTVPTYQEVLAVYNQMVEAKNGSVRFDIEQTLNNNQKAQARANIESTSEKDFTEVKNKQNQIDGSLQTFVEKVENELMTKEITEITKTSQTDSRYIRYINQEWETINNNTYFHLLEFPVEEKTKYRLVNGSIYKPFVPSVIFLKDDAIIGSTEVPTEATYQGTRIPTQEFFTPPGCNKIYTNIYGGMVTYPPALYKIEYGSNNILKWRRWLTEEDDAFYLSTGIYGIYNETERHPANLPDGMTLLGNLIVLRSDDRNNNKVSISIVIENYRKRVWFYSGYGYFEIPDTDDLTTVEKNVFSSIIPSVLEIARNFYIGGDEFPASKTQFRFLDDTGVKTIGNTFTRWYVIENLSVDPLTFYCITASAQYNNHYLYQLLDAEGKIITGEKCTSSTVIQFTNKLIFTPSNASAIRIASIYGADGLSLNKAEYNTTISRKWVGLKWACMGDSLTAVNARTTIHYHDYIAERTGISVVNLGAGGTGYKKSYAGVGPFMDRTDTIPIDSDVVTIFGSGNDGSFEIGEPTDSGTETLCGCINTTIDRIFSRMPTCNIGLITPTPWQPYNPASDTNWMARYSAAIKEICRRRGIPCLDLYHCSNLRPWDQTFRERAYSKDDGGGVHPDETGHKLFAPQVELFLDSLLLH